MPRAGSCRRRTPREPSDIIPRCRALVPPCASQKRKKWTTFTPPAAGLSRRYRGRLSYRRSQPASPFDEVSGKIRDLYEEAHNWLDGEPIASQEQADAVQKLMRMIQAAEKE